MRGSLLAAATLLAPFCVCAETPTVQIKRNDPSIVAAYSRARAGLDGFLAALDRPPSGATNFVVKIGLADTADGKGLTIIRGAQDTPLKPEFFWVGSIRRKGGGFEGKVANTPEIVRNVSSGQSLYFAKDDISDWMYRQGGKIVGNATACPLVARLPPQERKAVRDETGLDCE